MKRFENLSLKMSYLLPASEGWGKVTFSVCSHIWGGYPIQVWGGGVPWPGLECGGEYPILGVGVPQPGLDGWGYPIPGLGWGGTLAWSRWWGELFHPRGGGCPVRSGWWGVPRPGLDGWRVPQSGLDGGGSVPPWPGLDGGGYRPPTRQSSIVSTCYAAGSMPLAFMQEDFLVRK